MKIQHISQDLQKIRSDLLCVMLSEEQMRKAWSGALHKLDASSGQRLHSLAQEEGFAGRSTQRFLLRSNGEIAARRVALVGVGPESGFKLDVLRRAAARCRQIGKQVKAKNLAIVIPEALFPAEDRPEALSAVVEGSLLAAYRFDKYLSQKSADDKAPVALKTLQIVSSKIEARKDNKAIHRGEVMARAVALARDLVNEPAGHLTPKILAKTAKSLFKNKELQFSVLGPAQIKKEKMQLLLAVSAGSVEPPQVVRMAYKAGKKNAPTLVLVGKGITFDAGGLDIKSPAGMLGMKVDMAGSAAVLATMQAVTALKLKANVIAYLACAENMLGAAAYKPGDIIKSRAGLSVEIANTDAEGRLVLADTLSLASKDKPKIVIDVATLTGACMVALGPYTAGLMSNDQDLTNELLDAGLDAGEDLWPLPLNEALRPQLKSPIADLKNVGGRMGGAITAALFLREFIPKDSRWAHLDIAGPATAEKNSEHIRKGGTGFGVGTLVRFIERMAV